MFKKIGKLFIYVIILPIYWMSYFFPKDKNLWIFGAWFGEKYADNSKYLFEYVNKNQPEIRAVWLTKNKNTLKLIKNKGYEVYPSFSLMGYWLSMRGKVGILSSGKEDINRYASGKMKIVNLWHGTPLKKLMYDDRVTFTQSKIARFKFIIPFLNEYSKSILIATSQEVKKIFSGAFKVPINDIKITGYPRNDVFFSKNREEVSVMETIENCKSKDFRVGIYMPTHRRGGKFDIASNLSKELQFIDAQLGECGVILLIKLHFCHLKNNSKLKVNFNNMIFLNDEDINQDIYSILPITDFLITDYSSVYFDYLLLDKPIIFTPFDIEDYVKNDREFYYNYNDVTPGPKAKNWQEVLECIKEVMNSDMYKADREKIRNTFHEFVDGNNSKRVFNEIIKANS